MDQAAPIELGSFPLAVYGAMFGATVAGQFLGVGLDAAVGQRVLWVPIACSAVLEAVVGARFAASRVPRELHAADWARLSGYYSAALALFTVPLAIWTAASRGQQGQSTVAPASALGIGLGALALVTLVRGALMILLSPRRAA